MTARRDRVGLGWRPELAAGILAHAESVDAVEVIAEEWTGASRVEMRRLRTLGTVAPVWIHGVSLGLASPEPVERRRLDAVARLVDAAMPEGWSEHLAFVRGGGVELGHLAAPPRRAETLDGLARNAAVARRVVGTPPLLENVATLVAPPGSACDEATFTAAALERAGAGLLLDLHNLHANETNFGCGAPSALPAFAAFAPRVVHVAGGLLLPSPRATDPPRILDDHCHAVPSAVLAMLEDLAAATPNPLTVFLERDGRWPPFAELLAELGAIRGALRRGRARAAETAPASPTPRGSGSATTPAEAPPPWPPFEEWARALGSDAPPRGFLAAAPPDFDREGLALARRSFRRKRVAAAERHPVARGGALATLRAALAALA